MKLPGWWKDNMENRATTTWITHAVATAFVPFVLALLFHKNHSLLAACLWSWVIALLFWLRELSDERKAKEEDRWREPGLQGVTPLVDKFGDLIGPFAVAVTYTLGVILS